MADIVYNVPFFSNHSCILLCVFFSSLLSRYAFDHWLIFFVRPAFRRIRAAFRAPI